MCNQKHYGEERASAFLRLRIFMGKLRKPLSLLAAARETGAGDFDEEELEVPMMTVPDDVKEGHFAVLAVKGDEKRRFVVRLKYLNSPEFSRLLEQAEEEYGFEHSGALVVPCRPEELQKILERNCGDQIEF
ncbi:auxin-responsive protein SAUR50-like [Morus notabilis]|uniref:auxin-responsive protein SAUR50-like n=1 Tax=Morus notabilis TaxID=981085 RepID=UPI000CED073D|nr:auxin-responsive protein SAUR50-like [Morus notabilis]